MSKDSRVSLQRFIAALENHFVASTSKRSDNDPEIIRAYETLEAAFLDYEEALQDQFEEYLPFELAEDE